MSDQNNTAVIQGNSAMKTTILKSMSKTIFTVLSLILFTLLAGSQAYAAEKITFYHYDLLGSPVATTNELGEVIWREEYGPWGEKLLDEDAAHDNVRDYTGHVHDRETGLTYMQARYYDPQIGRFMGMDPVGFQEKNPIMFNRYAYANNNPYKFTDPNGEAGSIARGLASTGTYGTYGYGAAPGMTAEQTRQAALAVDQFAASLRDSIIGMLSEETDETDTQSDLNDNNENEAKPGAPAVDGDPYSPSEVSKRQSDTRRDLGVNPDPDTSLPDLGPGKNLKDGVHTSDGKNRHNTGERNVSSSEEHSMNEKGNGMGIH